MFGIVILNYLNYIDTIELLNSISFHKWSLLVKVYVVENGSPNSSEKYLRIETSKSNLEITYIQLEKNLGFAKGENVGINRARFDGCDFVISINNDVIIPKNQTEILSIFHKIYSRNQCAIITPVIKSSKGKNQNPLELLPPTTLKIIILKLFFLLRLNWLYYFIRVHLLFDLISNYVDYRDNKRLAVEEKKQLLDSGYIYAAHGSFQVFTPIFFEFFDGHDEQVFLYYEEHIKAEQLRRKNLKIWFENSIQVVHKTSKSVEMHTQTKKKKIKFLLLTGFDSYKIYVKTLNIF